MAGRLNGRDKLSERVLFDETCVEQGGDGFLVEMLTDEDQFLHPVAVGFVPIAEEVGVALLHHLQLGCGHRGIPLPDVLQLDLLAGLFKQVADVFFAFEVADSFCPNDAFWP